MQKFNKFVHEKFSKSTAFLSDLFSLIGGKKRIESMSVNEVI